MSHLTCKFLKVFLSLLPLFSNCMSKLLYSNRIGISRFKTIAYTIILGGVLRPCQRQKDSGTRPSQNYSRRISNGASGWLQLNQSNNWLAILYTLHSIQCNKANNPVCIVGHLLYLLRPLSPLSPLSLQKILYSGKLLIFLPHLADLAATANFYFWLSISFL